MNSNDRDGGGNLPMFTTCEMHTCGEPVRIIESGFPAISRKTILQKLSYIKENCDFPRKFLMLEPRGHVDMFGTVQVEPDLPDADVAFIFMFATGYVSMCGHCLISLGRYCVDSGLVKYQEPETLINIQCPCGLVPTYVSCKNGSTGTVRFQSVPSYVYDQGFPIDVPGSGVVKADIAYGGAFYVIVAASDLGIDLSKIQRNKVVKAWKIISDILKDTLKLEHPTDDDLAVLHGAILTDTTEMNRKNLVRQVVIYGDSMLDRSPCGSGTSAHVALLHSKGHAGLGESITFQSAVTEHSFVAKAVKSCKFGKHDAVNVEVSGKGYYIGRNTFTAEEDDPLKSGFMIN